jgi:WhiB family redox-sensing transcriptional regulator
MNRKGREHGTHACYVFGPAPGAGKGCRCDPCRAARASYERDRQRRVEPSYVGAARARHHIEELKASGVGLKQIARRANVSHGSLSKLIYGDATRGTPPSKRIRKATEDAILSVQPTDTADGAKVPAAPTHADVEELVGRGWTRTAIAHAIGQAGPGLQLGTTYVTAGHARTIQGLLDLPVPPRRTRWSQPEPVETPIEVPTPRNRWAPVAFEEDTEEPIEPPAPAAYDLPVFDDEGDTTWMRRGACRGPRVPTWMFFPGVGDVETVEAARAVCATCSVAEPCLTYALEHGEHGIWGGTSENERRRMQRFDVA